jgi:transposase-like protein
MIRKGEASMAEVAKDFGISESWLRNWLTRRASHRLQAVGDSRVTTTESILRTDRTALDGASGQSVRSSLT